MDNERFTLLISVLENLEKEDVKNSNIETAIVKIINVFDNDLTKEQKKTLLKEFVRYERFRQEDSKNRKNINDDEKNRELLQSFLSGDTFKWGY